MESLIPLVRSAAIIMIPLLFAAAGGLFPALAGKLNIALEGLLLVGAFTALSVYHFTGSIVIAIISAAIAAMALSVLHIFAVFRLRANLFIAGLAINLFSGGLCIVLSDRLFNTRGVVAAQPVISQSAPNLFSWYLFSGVFLLFVMWLVIYKMPFGFRLRACDKHSEALNSLGIKSKFYQITAFLISGLLCGIGGSFLSLNLGAFVPGMSAGRGWIALVIIFLGGRKPAGILAAAFVYGLAEAFSIRAQGFWNLPADFLLAFPYILTLIAMIVVSVYSKLGNKN